MRTGAGIFDVSHMGEVETSGPGAGALLQRLLSNDVDKLAVGGAQYSVLCREDGGVLDDLFTYRLAEDRYLTVTNAANHAKDLAWFQRARRGLRRARRGPARRLGDARDPGPARARDRRGASRRRRCPRASAARRSRSPVTRRSSAAPATPARTASRSSARREAAGAIWDAALAGGARPGRPRRARHAAAGGLLPPLRQRPDGVARADRGRASAGAARSRPGFIGAEAVAAAREAGPGGEARAVHDRGRRDRAPGQPGRRRRRGHERHDVAARSGIGIGLAYLPAERAAEGNRFDDRRARPRARRRRRRQAALQAPDA